MASTEFATRSHKGAGFLFFVGFALVAVGAGFTFAPHFSWQLAKIARQASELGLENASLVVAGLVFFGLGIVARVSASAPVHDTRGENEALQAELHLVNEQLSTKIAQLRTSLLQIHESVVAVSTQQHAQMQEQSDKGASGDHSSQDAVFRLAASLDKLHAHFDERVHAVDLQLRSGFETLLNICHELRRTLGSHAVSAGSAPAHAQHAHGQQQPPESGIDFYETMQKLDAIAGEPSGLEVQGRQPQAPFPSPQGEALDAFMPEEYRDRY